MKKLSRLLSVFCFIGIAQFSYADCNDAYFSCVDGNGRFIGYVSLGGATNFIDATPPRPYFPMWYHPFIGCLPKDTNSSYKEACAYASSYCQKFFPDVKNASALKASTGVSCGGNILITK